MCDKKQKINIKQSFIKISELVLNFSTLINSVNKNKTIKITFYDSILGYWF